MNSDEASLNRSFASGQFDVIIASAKSDSFSVVPVLFTRLNISTTLSNSVIVISLI